MTRSPELEAAIARAGARAREHGWDGPGRDHVVVELLAIPALREQLQGADLDLTELASQLSAGLPTLVPTTHDNPTTVAEFLVQLELERDDAVAVMVTPRIALGRLLMQPRRFETMLRAHGLVLVDVLYALAHGVARRDLDRAPPPPPARAWIPRLWFRRRERLGTYRVFVHNDDFTTRAAVHETLVDWFDIEPADASSLVGAVHREGHGVVGLFALDDAARRIDEATRFAHDRGHPLRFSFEPADD
nr:ATP-dependent Clp protease adaptor ClpS [Kofleriaceae bacterium]